MAWLRPASMLPLALLLHTVAAASEPNIFRVNPQAVQANIGAKVELKCELIQSGSMTVGCTWLFQGLDPRVSPKFLAYSRKPEQSKINNISVKKEKDVFFLSLDGLREDQLGYYFCMVIISSVPHFSAYIPVLLSASTTKPTTTTTTLAPTWTSTNSPRELDARPETCETREGNARVKTGLDFSCDIYIWAPLAGTCAVLLFSLATVLVCSHRKRRRVCKCPRPQVRLGGKLSPSERSV